MLKEYRFRLNYEYYPFKDKPKEDYYVNGHKIDEDSFDYLFLKIFESDIPMDTCTNFYWKNCKTGSYTQTKCWTFNKEAYPWEEEKRNN